MSEMMTIPVPERAVHCTGLSSTVLSSTVRHAARVASLTRQHVEDVLAGWLDWAAAEIPVETLPDDEILALCDLEMDEEQQQQQELSRLLAGSQEGLLDAEAQARLDELMQLYRHGLVRKAQALKFAVQRGLRPPLGSEPS